MGLNFRDVLNVLGMYPGAPGDPGNDCAGVVSAVGSVAMLGPSSPAANASYDSAVGEGLRPGDAAFGLAVGALGTRVHAPASTMFHMPDNISFEQVSSSHVDVLLSIPS